MRKIVNTCNIDTVYGDRKINLIKDNINNTIDDLIIFSTHADCNCEIDGEVYKALKEKYEMEVKNKTSIITKINNISIEYWKEKRNNSYKNFIMARIPTYENKETAINYHDKNIKAIFSTIKALEFNEISFKSISLPMLGGNKKIDSYENVKILLKYSIKYLRESKATENINFYTIGDEAEVDWNKAFEKTLGRSYYKVGSLQIIETLKENLKSTIETIYQDERFKELNFVLNLIYRELEEVDSLSINNIAINSRKICEIIAKELASKKEISIKKIKNDLSSIINLLSTKDIIAPWVIQYMHMARVFGNKSAHVESLIKYEPNRLYSDDFIAILTTLYNLLWFWYYNKEKI